MSEKELLCTWSSIMVETPRCLSLSQTGEDGSNQKEPQPYFFKGPMGDNNTQAMYEETGEPVILSQEEAEERLDKWAVLTALGVPVKLDGPPLLRTY